MRGPVFLIAIVVLGSLAAARAQAPVDFARDIQPIFAQRCIECHGEKRQKGGVRFDRKETVFKGGDSGQPVVLPGKSAGSPLIERVTTEDSDEVMPPKGEKLTAEQIALLKRWIDSGAPWPEDARGAQKHWAYEKPVRPALPAVKNNGWPRNAIDHFMLEKLEQEKLQPAPEADRAILLRRVSLDLIGLPPSVAEVNAFLTDTNANAFERVVDRLLSSPHFGERWARPWLDIARYADTQGYEKDNRRSIWPWRNWVINALNRNLPFDEFTIEQIAGDLLPNAAREQKVATGFHRNTMTNTEGGTDDEEFRHEAVVDRVNTTMAAWMATTMNCAQCHNHKYDPLTMREYYQLYDFFNHTADADKDNESPTMKLPTPEQEFELAKRRDTLKSAEAKWKAVSESETTRESFAQWEKRTADGLTNWQTLDPAHFVSLGGATLTKTASKSVLASGKNPSNDTYVVTLPVPAARVTGLRLEVLENGDAKTLGRHENGSFVLGKVEAAVARDGETNAAVFARVAADFSQKENSVSNLLAGTGNGWAVAAFDAKNRVRRSAYFTFKEPLVLDMNAQLQVTLRHTDKFPGANVQRFRFYTTTAETVGPTMEVPEEVRAILFTAADKRDEKQRKKLKEHFESTAPELKEPREALAAAKKAEKEYFDAIPSTMVFQELEKPRVTHMMIRGSFLNKGERVSAGVPAVFHSIDTNAPLNRLTFARWLVDTNNPLTARVVVNRFWEQLFGIGLVETSEDFGTQGELPSHPALLDWLAVEWMSPTDEAAQPWDTKRLLKLIVTSATYRQNSRVTPELAARDPYNRLLARGPRQRLEAEMVRDQALAVSGLLSRKPGGAPVMPPQPEGIWQVVYSGDKWETSSGEDKYRRGLYTFWRRTSPYPSMITFDAPSREFCVLRRSRSNTPLQALTLLNDPVYLEAARALAETMLAQNGTAAERATHGFRACLARDPKPSEIEKLTALAEKELAHYRDNADAATQLVKFTGAKPVEDSAAELAAWTVVANVLLNLDEFVMKP